MSNATLVLLAAGEQTRWEGDGPKCLAKIGDETVIERLDRQFMRWNPMGSVVAVCDPDAVSISEVMRTPPRGPDIGHSILTGLDAVREGDSVIIMAADTFLPEDTTFFSMPCRSYTLFDPWAWVTVQYVTPKWMQSASLTAQLHVESRIEMATYWPGDVVIQRTGSININTIADLERAREEAKS